MNFDSKKLVGYGTGITMLGTIEAFPLDFNYFIDDNEGVVGQQIMERPIYPSSKLLEEKPNAVFIVVFASNYKSTLKIFEKLIQLDLRKGEDFIDCFELQYLTIAEKLEREMSISSDYKLLNTIKTATGNAPVPNLSTPTGTWLYSHLLRQALREIDGDIAECGVYFGGNALITHQSLPEVSERRYHLFDSFEGFENISANDPKSRGGDFQDNDFEFVKSLFKSFPNVVFHKGYFNETFEEMQPRDYALVYIDCDLYEPTIECLDYFGEKVLPGGMILIHDYWFPNIERPKGSKSHFEGIQKAVKEYTEHRNDFDILVFPETTHCLLIKK